MFLPEDFDNALMAAWDQHVGEIVASERTLGPVAQYSAQVRQAAAQLEQAVAGARSAGQS